MATHYVPPFGEILDSVTLRDGITGEPIAIRLITADPPATFADGRPIRCANLEQHERHLYDCPGIPHPDTRAVERVHAIVSAARAGEYARNGTGSMDFGRGVAWLAQRIADAIVQPEAG